MLSHMHDLDQMSHPTATDQLTGSVDRLLLFASLLTNCLKAIVKLTVLVCSFCQNSDSFKLTRNRRKSKETYERQ